MFAKITKKWAVPLIFCTAMFLGAAGDLHAFSVDVSHLFYADPAGAPGTTRQVDYDFSSGWISANVISIPDAAVQKPAADDSLTYLFGPYPDPTNDIALQLTGSPQICRLSTTTQGGAIIYTNGNPPSITSPQSEWIFAAKLQNFSDTTPGREFRAQIGMGSMSGGIQPELKAIWLGDGTLNIQAEIYDNSGSGTSIWTAAVGLGSPDKASAVLELRIARPAPDDILTFEYNLNSGGWLSLGTYHIPADQLLTNFLSFPAFFPYVDIREEALENPFQVSSQHWDDANGNTYSAWPRVMDPGQALYSSVTANSPGYLTETPMTFNSAAGYWSFSGTLFSDNFDDNTVDPVKWSTQGSSVTESGGEFHVDHALAVNGGKALSQAIVVNPYATIVVQRKANVHYANNDFDGNFVLYFGDTAAFVPSNESKQSVFVSHANYVASSGTEQTVHGFYIGRDAAHLINSPTAGTDAIWDTWFVEKIVYNPVSGLAELWIDGVQKATINVGALPTGARYLKIALDAWGLSIGNSNDSDDLAVSQPWTGGGVYLSNNTPPLDTVVFNFTATKKAGGTDSVSKTITGYVTDFATNLAPTGNVTSATPVFSWTGITGATFYGVQVSDANGNRIWNAYSLPSSTTSAVYNFDGKGPALVSGQTYYYEIVSTIVTAGINNDSFAKGSFTFTGTVPETIVFSGAVKTAPSWPALNDVSAADGASVSAYLPGITPTLINTVLANSSTGVFALTGIPKSTPFYLLVQPQSGYMPVLSKLMNSDADIQALLPFVLFTPIQYATTLGNTTGNGIIIGRVALFNAPTSFLAGATIEAREWTSGNPPVLGATYPVTYSGGGSATDTDGIYMVKNIPSGKQVRLVATLNGYTFAFNEAIVPVWSDVVSEESFFALPPTKGDINGDGIVNLYDAVLALQVMAGNLPAGLNLAADVNGDNKIGMAEAIYALQVAAGLRTP